MPTVDLGAVTIAYEDAGPPDAPPILLIMGLGAQLVFWPDAFVDGLVDAGFRVIRFDNRDVGLSTALDHAVPPHPLKLVAASLLRLPVRVPYTLDDMAADAVGLLDALGIDRAHVVGASMGGMIAQLVAARHPERVRSLVSIMSSSGERGLPGPSPEIGRRIMKGRPATGDRAALIDAGVSMFRLIGTADPARSDADMRAMVEQAFDRSYNPAGSRRQLAAIIAGGGRAAALARIAAPTLVIHGSADRLVPPACGADTAARIPGARLEIVEGMAHDLPPSHVPTLVRLVADHAAAADAEMKEPAAAA